MGKNIVTSVVEGKVRHLDELGLEQGLLTLFALGDPIGK